MVWLGSRGLLSLALCLGKWHVNPAVLWASGAALIPQCLHSSYSKPLRDLSSRNLLMSVCGKGWRGGYEVAFEEACRALQGGLQGWGLPQSCSCLSLRDSLIVFFDHSAGGVGDKR